MTARSRRTIVVWTLAPILALIAVVAGTLLFVENFGDDLTTAEEARVTNAQATGRNIEGIVERIETQTEQIEGGVEVIGQGYRCLIALILVQPDERASLSAERIASVCGLDPVEIQLLSDALP